MKFTNTRNMKTKKNKNKKKTKKEIKLQIYLTLLTFCSMCVQSQQQFALICQDKTRKKKEERRANLVWSNIYVLTYLCICVSIMVVPRHVRTKYIPTKYALIVSEVRARTHTHSHTHTLSLTHTELSLLLASANMRWMGRSLGHIAIGCLFSALSSDHTLYPDLSYLVYLSLAPD